MPLSETPASEIPLPRLQPLDWLAAVVRREELAGAPRWTVTTRDGIAPPRRTWHRNHAEALTWAASEAERLGLPLFDLSTADEAE